MRVVVKLPDGEDVAERIEEAISLAEKAREILESLTVEPELTFEIEPTDGRGQS